MLQKSLLCICYMRRGLMGKSGKKKPYWYRLTVFTLTSLFLGGVAYILGVVLIRNSATYVTIDNTRELFKVNTTIRHPGKLAFGKKENILILCMGLDENRDLRGIGYTKGSRTDTIFVLSLNRHAKRLGILSIPRDTWVYINDKYGYGKINSVYANAFWDEYDKSGDYEKAQQAGIMQLRKTIQDFLGVNVDYYVLLKIKAVKELVDAIGGVTVDVEKDMDYDDNWGKLHIHLKKGKQKLKGEELVGYARFRHDAEGDWGRIRRQQQVISALVRELKKPIHIMHIDNIAKVVKENIDTDLTLSQIIDIAHVYKDFNRDNIVKGVVSGYDDWAAGMMIVVPDEGEVHRLVRRVLRNPEDILPEEIRVQVINASNFPALGDSVAEKLRAEGFVVNQVAWDGQEKKTFTDIVDHYHNPQGVKVLRRALGFKGGEIVFKPNTNLQWPVDFTLILGDDYYEYEQAMNPPKSPLPMPQIDKEPAVKFQSTEQ